MMALIPKNTISLSDIEHVFKERVLLDLKLHVALIKKIQNHHSFNDKKYYRMVVADNKTKYLSLNEAKTLIQYFFDRINHAKYLYKNADKIVKQFVYYEWKNHKIMNNYFIDFFTPELKEYIIDLEDLYSCVFIKTSIGDPVGK